MTETEWLAYEEPEAMLRALPASTATERKCRLFSVGCCLKLLLYTPNEIAWRVAEVDYRADDERALATVLIAERYADSTVTAAERQEAEAVLGWVCSEHQGEKIYDACFSAVCGAANAVVAFGCALDTAHAVMKPWPSDEDDDWEEQYRQNAERLKAAQRWQAALTRCIFGNPFRPAKFVPAWRTSTVVALAQGIYEDRAFDRMPILADALQDAGCDSDDVLNHCRADTVHARGCWVVDLVLGKV